MGQRPTPFTPKFIPEIQLVAEPHPDDTTADFLSGNKKTPLTGSSQAIRATQTPTFTGVRVFYTRRVIRQSTNPVDNPDAPSRSYIQATGLLQQPSFSTSASPVSGSVNTAPDASVMMVPVNIMHSKCSSRARNTPVSPGTA